MMKIMLDEIHIHMILPEGLLQIVEYEVQL